jgi:hypothetical protein
MKLELATAGVIARALGRAVRRGTLATATGIATCFAGPVLASATIDTPARFAVQAELRPLAVSDDGRFAVDARARHAPEGTSADRRYTLKALNVPAVGCEPAADPLFANGFE